MLIKSMKLDMFSGTMKSTLKNKIMYYYSNFKRNSFSRILMRTMIIVFLYMHKKCYNSVFYIFLQIEAG